MTHTVLFDRAAIVTSWRPIADRVIRARIGQAPVLEHDDIRSDGYLGLLQAVETWRPHLGPAEPHVGFRVHTAIIDGHRARHGRTGTARRAAQHVPLERDDLDGLSPLDYLSPDPDEDLELFAAHADEQRVRALLRRLPPRERLVVRETFLNRRTLLSVANQLGITESRVCQIRTAALADVVRDRICAGCRTTFTPHDWRQRYCNRPCRTRAGTARSLGKVQQPDGTWAYPARRCRVCNQPFPVWNPRKTYCSRPCQQRTKPRTARDCPVCGVTFTPQNDGRTYCSHRCYRHQMNLNDKRRRPA